MFFLGIYFGHIRKEVIGCYYIIEFLYDKNIWQNCGNVEIKRKDRIGILKTGR